MSALRGRFHRPLISLAAGLMVLGGALWQPAAAQSGGFESDPDAPVEVFADAAEYDQPNRLGIFTGNVIAKQAGLTLEADKVTVGYTMPEDSGGEGPSEITELNANGHVRVSSARENARGDWAKYLVKDGIIRMGGNVILVRGENVLRGNALVINLETGQSRIEGGASGTSGGGRVRGLFVPPSNNNDGN